MRASEEDYAISFTNLCLMDFLTDKIYSNTLIFNFRTTRVRSVGVGNIAVVKSQSLPNFAEILDKDAATAKTLGSKHLDGLSLYISFKNNVLLIIHAADAFVKNTYELALLE